MANLRFDILHRVISFLDESKGYELCWESDESTKGDDDSLNDDHDDVEMGKKLAEPISHIEHNADMGHRDNVPGECINQSNDPHDLKDYADHGHSADCVNRNNYDDYDDPNDFDDHGDHDNHNVPDDDDDHNVHDDDNDNYSNDVHDHDSNNDDYEYDDFDYTASLGGSRDPSMIYHVSVLEDAANKRRNRSLAKLNYDRARNILEEQMDNDTISKEVLSNLLDDLCEAYKTLENANNAYLPYLDPNDKEWEKANIYMENAYRDRCRIQAAISKRVLSRPVSGMFHRGINHDILTKASRVSIGNNVQMFLI